MKINTKNHFRKGDRELACLHLEQQKKIISPENLKPQFGLSTVCAQIPTALGAQAKLSNRIQSVPRLVVHPGAQQKQSQKFSLCHLNQGLKVLPQIKFQGKRAAHHLKL